MKKNTKKVDIIIVAVILVIIAAVVLAVMFRPEEKEQPLNEPAGSAAEVKYTDYDGKRLGIMTGSSFEQPTFEHFPNSEYSYYDNISDLILALQQGKIDGFVQDEPVLRMASIEQPTIGYFKECLRNDTYSVAFQKTGEKSAKLRQQFDEMLSELNEDGTLDELKKKWFSVGSASLSVDRSGITGENGTLSIAVNTTNVPFALINNGEISGYEVELVTMFCRRYGYDCKYDQVNTASGLAGLASGVYDIYANNTTVTPERAESVAFSEPIYEGGITLAVRASEITSDTSGGAVEDRPFSYYADNKKIGVITGGLYEVMIRERYPNADLYQYNNQADLGAALDAGLIDCFTVPRSTAEDFKKQYNGFTYLNEVFTKIPYGFAFEKSADKEYLRDQMNDFLKKIQSDGTYDEIISVWFGDNEDKKIVDSSGLTGENGSLKMVTTATMQPFSYIKDGKNAGLEIDLVTRFCREYGYLLSIDSAEFASLIPGITSSMYNIAAGNIMITKERAESVNFSDVYYTADAVAVVKDENRTARLRELNSPDKKVGYGTGTSGMFAVEKYLPDAQHVDYSDSLTGYEAVKLGMLDAFVFEKRQMQIAIDNGLTGVVLLEENLGEDTEVAVGLSRRSSVPDLKTKINSFISELKAEGTLDDMYVRWAVQGKYEMPELNRPQAPTMKIIVGTTGVVEPYSFYKDNALTGYDIEMAERFGVWMNAEIEYRTFDYPGVVAAAESGAIDCIFANLNVTDERKETIDFSDPIYIMENGVMVSASNNVVSEKNSWLDSIAQSFEKNFIREDRWKMILDGIGTTCLITVMSTLFGTILAFLICMFRRTGSRLANAISNIYVKLLQGTPMVVLLMILYYVVFGNILTSVWVAIIGFSLNVGAYVSEIMRSGIESIDGGQREAALALGYSENQAFFRFIFPQAAVRFLPVYKQEIVSLLKSTSIVGYIAIQDLTKMSDIIRSRTYEAFFPLIATAIIYFILAWIISMILKFVLKAISPKRKGGAAK